MNNNINILKDNLDSIAVYANRYYQEVWRHSYPIAKKTYSKNTIDLSMIDRIKNLNEYVMYIDIPFCESNCDYCRYFKPGNILKIGSDNYVNCLIKELSELLNNSKKQILSILIGGGTPNLLSPDSMERLLVFLRKNFIFNEGAEICVEVSPHNLSNQMISILIDNGVNRISIGVQTFNEGILKEINRPQSNKDVYSAFKKIRDNKTCHTNIDIIYGLLVNESVDKFLNDNLEHIHNLKPDSVEIFPLQLYKMPERIREFDINAVKQIAKEINKCLGSSLVNEMIPIIHNMEDHRNNFPAKRSAYFNLRRVELKNVIGIGTGANSNIWLDNIYITKRNRYRKINEYVKSIDENNLEYDYLSLDKEESLRKYLIQTLCHGINIELVKEKYFETFDLFEYLMTAISNFTNEQDGMIFLKPNFEEFLDFKTNNQNTNYFILCFLHLYSDKAREDLLLEIK